MKWSWELKAGLQGCWGINSLGWGRVSGMNPKGMASLTKYPIQTHLDKHLQTESPSIVMNCTSLSHHFWRVTVTVSLIDQEKKKAISFPFERILFIHGRILLYTHWPSFHLTNQISPLQCILHTAARVIFIKHSLKHSFLKHSYRIWNSNSLAVLAFPHTTYLSTLLCFCSGGNDMPFSAVLNLSKCYFLSKSSIRATSSMKPLLILLIMILPSFLTHIILLFQLSTSLLCLVFYMVFEKFLWSGHLD